VSLSLASSSSRRPLKFFRAQERLAPEGAGRRRKIPRGHWHHVLPYAKNAPDARGDGNISRTLRGRRPRPKYRAEGRGAAPVDERPRRSFLLHPGAPSAPPADRPAAPCRQPTSPPARNVGSRSADARSGLGTRSAPLIAAY
jgi:hypothetical protein